MKILETGTLSNVTGAVFGSGVSTAPIELSRDNLSPTLGFWFSIAGDTGRTGGSIAVVAKGCYQKGGTTYAVESTELVKSGTSVSGKSANGSYWVMKDIVAPWMRLEAVASKSGSTQHGTGTTYSCVVRYAICQ